jgi:hypothetical protein
MSVLNMNPEQAQALEESKGELFPSAPAGIYDARIVGVKDHASGENSKHPGTPMWKITYALETGDENDGIRVDSYQTMPAGEGTDWMDASEVTRRINELKRLWMACGLEIPADGSLDSDDLVNSQLQVSLGQEEFPKDSGKMKNNVKDVLAI